MLTLDTISNINDIELKNLLNWMNYRHDLSDIEFYEKLFASNDELSQKIRLELGKLLYDKLITNELINAMFMSNDLKYKKQIAICNNLFLEDGNQEYYNVLSDLFDRQYEKYTSEPNKYKNILSFISRQKITFPYDIDLPLTCFMDDEDNKYAIGRIRQKYLSFDEERLKLENILNQENFDYKAKGIIVPESLTRDKRICLGHVGEYYTENYLLTRRTKFISRDLGDGFGFDHYYNLEENTETLAESKATLGSEEDDFFYISDNELRVIRDVLKLNNAYYRIFRSFISEKTIAYNKMIVLAPTNNGNTLESINERPIEQYYYELECSDKGMQYKKKLKTK